MGRPIYNYELTDPDFSWLINSYKENNPNYALVEASGVPVSFISAGKSLAIKEISEPANDEFQEQAQSEPATDSDNISENK